MNTSAKIIGLLVAALIATGYGYSRFNRSETARPTFHDICVNYTHDYISIVKPYSPEVANLAIKLQTPEAAYEFVRDRVTFVPFAPSGSVEEIISKKKGCCLGKAALLYSLYRSLGIPSSDVRIVVGILVTPSGPADHVWIDMEFKGESLQQDASGMIGKFGFYDFRGNKFVESHVMKELYCFNEEGFALISQLNRFRNSPMTAPH